MDQPGVGEDSLFPRPSSGRIARGFPTRTPSPHVHRATALDGFRKQNPLVGGSKNRLAQAPSAPVRELAQVAERGHSRPDDVECTCTPETASFGIPIY